MNANVPMLNEIAGKNTKEVIDALNETIRQQQAEIEALKKKIVSLEFLARKEK
jgi:cell division protein FtsB